MNIDFNLVSINPPHLELFIDPGDAPEGVIQDVLEALSDLHLAAGGLGLEFHGFREVSGEEQL